VRKGNEGRTYEELPDNIKEAVSLHFEENKTGGGPIIEHVCEIVIG
jgi:predicted RNase H-like HicB family nuclease